MNFVIHWNEKALGSHVFPIPIPSPTSLPTRSLQVLPGHQIRGFISQFFQVTPLLCTPMPSMLFIPNGIFCSVLILFSWPQAMFYIVDYFWFCKALSFPGLHEGMLHIILLCILLSVFNSLELLPFYGSEWILREFTTWPSPVSFIPNMLIPSSISRIWLFHYFPSYYCYSSSFCQVLPRLQIHSVNSFSGFGLSCYCYC